MKNKFFVDIGIVILGAIVWCAGVGVFIWYAIDAFGEDLWLAIFLTIMLAVLPTIVLVGVVMAFAAKVHIDEDGITKSLFGIRLKFYAW